MPARIATLLLFSFFLSLGLPSGIVSAEYQTSLFDEYLKFKFDSFYHYDVNDVHNSSVTKSGFQDGFRRARVILNTEVGNHLSFKADYDFINSNFSPRDLYTELSDLLPVNLRIGHFKEPFGLEELTSANNVNFIERASIRAFHPIRNNGLMLYGNTNSDTSFYAIGLFQSTDKHLNKANNNYSITARYTQLLSNQLNQRTHLGLGLRHLEIASENTIRINSMPEAFFVESILDSGQSLGSQSDTINLEFLTDYNSFYFQSEFLANFSKDSEYRLNYFNSYYLQAGYFLTGERRSYSAKRGTPGALENINSELGALEILGRFSSIDLNDKVQLGSMNNITFGINWHIKSYLKFMFNYIISDHDTVGRNNIMLARLQIELPDL